MVQSFVFYQGQILNESDVHIDIRSRAFNYGLGCFEGIRGFWNPKKKQMYLFRVRDHYERLLRSGKTLNINIPYTVDELISWTVKLIRANEFKTTIYIRPVAFSASNNIRPELNGEDDRILVYCLPLGELNGKDELRTSVASWTRVGDNMIPPRAKATAAYLNSALASLEAHQSGYDEAIFLTDDGKVAEGPGENIFIVREQVLITPPVSDNILEGITRATVMTLAKHELGLKVRERSIPRTELYAADEVFFTGTALGIKPVVEIDNRGIGAGHLGPVCRSLQKLYAEIVKGNSTKYRQFNTPIY